MVTVIVIMLSLCVHATRSPKPPPPLPQPICLCATNNKGSFTAVMTAVDDPSKFPPFTKNTRPSTYQHFHQVSPVATDGWAYLAAPRAHLSTYVYVWNLPLGFANQVPNEFGECLVVDLDGSMGNVMFRNYSFESKNNRRNGKPVNHTQADDWLCDTDHRGSQGSPNEVFLYACSCDEAMTPTPSLNGVMQCYRVNGTNECVADNCDTDTYHLVWNATRSPPCLSLCNGTHC